MRGINVAFCLLQAILCYAPKYLWDAWEGGLMSSLKMKLKHCVLPEAEKTKSKKKLVDYLLQHVEVRKLRLQGV